MKFANRNVNNLQNNTAVKSNDKQRQALSLVVNQNISSKCYQAVQICLPTHFEFGIKYSKQTQYVYMHHKDYYR